MSSVKVLKISSWSTFAILCTKVKHYLKGLLPRISNNVLSVHLSISQVLTTIIGVVAVHNRGRKPLLVASSAVCGVSLVVLGVFFWLKDAGRDVSAIEWLPLTSVILYLLGFGIGFGPIGYLFMGKAYLRLWIGCVQFSTALLTTIYLAASNNGCLTRAPVAVSANFAIVGGAYVTTPF